MTGLRSLLTLLLTLASVTAVTLLAAPGASAGSYTVFACSPTDSPGGWQPVNTFPSGLIVGNLCGGPATGPSEPQGPIDEGALFAEDSPEHDGRHPQRRRSRMELHPPQPEPASLVSPIGVRFTPMTSRASSRDSGPAKARRWSRASHRPKAPTNATPSTTREQRPFQTWT